MQSTASAIMARTTKARETMRASRNARRSDALRLNRLPSSLPCCLHSCSAARRRFTTYLLKALSRPQLNQRGTTMLHKYDCYDCVDTLRRAGFSYDDATALRRISMTLHRWHELECGDGNQYGSWAIVRGRKSKAFFDYDYDGAPFMEHHHYLHGKGKDYTS